MPPVQWQGGCYCKALRYLVVEKPTIAAQCHCRECQYFSGGAPHLFMLVSRSGFQYTQGAPAQFMRTDLTAAVTRDFCARCGTHILTRRPGLEPLILKVGTLDDPSVFVGPALALYKIDRPPYHHIPAGIPVFERLPSEQAHPSS